MELLNDVDHSKWPYFAFQEMKAPGCPWLAATGVIGISEKLVVFELDGAIGHAGELSARGRAALAKHMIALWQRFGAGEVHPDVKRRCAERAG